MQGLNTIRATFQCTTKLARINPFSVSQRIFQKLKASYVHAQVLKLRSSELKLRKELEGTQSGYDAARRQLTTLSADRAALRQMMDALQEGERFADSGSELNENV